MLKRVLFHQHDAVPRCLHRASSQAITTHPFRTSQSRRNLHALPIIGEPQHHSRLREEGIDGLFSRDAFATAWTEYQQHMVDRLNTILANDPRRAQLQAKDLAIETAREPSLAPLFNYASMAHNNHFFFSGLSSQEVEMPPELKTNLERSFGSINTLRDTMLSTASAMFGPGFVWLVQESDPSKTHPATVNSAASESSILDGVGLSRQTHFRLLTTYLAGSPYPGAHHRQQGIDMNIQNMQSADAIKRQTRIQNSAGSFGRASAAAHGMGSIESDIDARDVHGDRRRFGGADLIPVLCVNTWEHCYLHDFGVSGKRDYLASWWQRIDWNRVHSLCYQVAARDRYRLA